MYIKRRGLCAFLILAILVGCLPTNLLAAEKKLGKSLPTSTTKLTRHIRYTGTGWGWITPLLFAGTRVFEAFKLEDVTTEERIDYATRWAKNPRFWGAVAADMASVYAAEALVAFLPFGPFIKNALVCFTGFAAFEGVYGGFGEVDWGTLAWQSLVLTGVEMGVAALGLPLGGFFPILASFAVCMLLDKFSGFDETVEDDDAYSGGEIGGTSEDSETLESGGYNSISTETLSSYNKEAYIRFQKAMQAGNRERVDEAYKDYRESSAALSSRRASERIAQ